MPPDPLGWASRSAQPKTVVRGLVYPSQPRLDDAYRPGSGSEPIAALLQALTRPDFCSYPMAPEKDRNMTTTKVSDVI